MKPLSSSPRTVMRAVSNFYLRARACVWLQRERRGHLVVRLTQLAILVVFLVLWEVLPQAHIVAPGLTSYLSALN